MTRLPECILLTVIGMHVSVVCAVRVDRSGVFRTGVMHGFGALIDMVVVAVMFQFWGVCGMKFLNPMSSFVVFWTFRERCYRVRDDLSFYVHNLSNE